MFFFDDTDLPLVSILIFLPILGTLFLLKIPSQNTQNLKNCALWISTVTFFIALLIFSQVDITQSSVQFAENYAWIAPYNLHYYVGVDAFTMGLVFLVTLTFPLTIPLLFETSVPLQPLHLIALFFFESGLLCSFCAQDILLFYIFSEMAFLSFLVLFYLAESSQTFKKNPYFSSLLFSSLAFLGVILTFTYYAGSSIFDVIHYETRHALRIPFFIKYVLLSAFTLRLGIFPFHRIFHSFFESKEKNILFLFYVYFFLSCVFYVFRLYPLISPTLSEALKIGLSFGLLFNASFAAWRQKKRNEPQGEPFRPSVIPLILPPLLIPFLNPSALALSASLLILTNYILLTSCLFLFPLFCEVPSLPSENSSKRIFYFFCMSFFIFFFLGFPPSCGFKSYVLAIRHLMAPSFSGITLAVYIVALFLFLFMGCDFCKKLVCNHQIFQFSKVRENIVVASLFSFTLIVLGFLFFSPHTWHFFIE